MASLTIRNLNDDIKAQLRVRAAANGHSMEQEARLILREAVSKPTETMSLASRLQNRFQGLDTGALKQPNRPPVPAALDFSNPENH